MLNLLKRSQLLRFKQKQKSILTPSFKRNMSKRHLLLKRRSKSTKLNMKRRRRTMSDVVVKEAEERESLVNIENTEEESKESQKSHAPKAKKVREAEEVEDVVVVEEAEVVTMSTGLERMLKAS